MKTKRNQTLILCLILAFSGLLYFYRLGRQESISTDEYFSLFVAQKPPQEIISSYTTASNPNTIPPLYVLILHYWLKLFGQSELAQRSLSAALGILSVYLLYRLTRLLLDRQTGLIAAALGAFSFTWLSVFRQDRCYSLFVLLSLLSFYYFFLLIKKRSQKRLLILIGINILLVYTHYFAFLVVILETIFGVIIRRKSKPELLDVVWMFAAVCLSYLPWYPNLVYDFFREPVMLDEPPVLPRLARIFDFSRVLFHDFHFIWNPFLSLIYIPFLLRGFLKMKEKSLNGTCFVRSYLVSIFVLPFILLFFIMGTDRIRYFSPFMFPLLIVLAYGLSGFKPKRAAGRLTVFGIGAIIISMNFADLADSFLLPVDEQWRQSAALIRRMADHYQDNKDTLVFQTRYNPPVFAYYYWGRDTAGSFIPHIATKADYADTLSRIGAREKIMIVRDSTWEKFFADIAKIPGGNRIWVFRYHDPNFKRWLLLRNRGRYFIRSIKLNKTLPPTDLFLLKRIREAPLEAEPDS